MKLENLGSLITIAGTNQCLGDLLHAPGHGTFDPTHGRVDVSAEQAKLHNEALDKAKLEGLDANCEIGQGGYFYFSRNPMTVKTFMGTVVSTDCALSASGANLTFRRAGKVYRGRLSKQNDAFNFRRIA